MKQCPKCHTVLADNATFCTGCGTRMAPAVPNQNVYAPVGRKRGDRTAEFNPGDIAANKAPAMLVYLAGWLGIIVAMLKKEDSAYLKFHIDQALKLKVLSTLLLIIAAPIYILLDMIPTLISFRFVYVLPNIVVLAVVITEIVIRILFFAQVSSGKAVESSLTNSMSFLK